MSLAADSHATARALALSGARAAALNALVYANARTPGHPGFTFEEEPTEAGLHKMRPVYLCCFGHREECRAAGPVVQCALADGLRLGSEPSSPAFVCGVDLGMSARVGPAWVVREWLPMIQLARALH